MVFTKQISKLIITSSLFLSCSLALGPRLTIAAEVPVQATSFAKAPYSKLFTTGSVYAVKDKDFTSGDSSVGVFTLWSKNPINNDIQVTINYALHDKYIANPSAYLTGITLMDNNQPLLTINQLVKADSAHTKITRPGYYESFDALWADNFWDNPFWGDEDPVYIPPSTASGGFSQFDISQLSNDIAQLPNHNLQMRLMFNNGEIQTWHLGKRTVEALKDLVAID
ncbi:MULTISPECIES: hypothetical protein [Nostocales]|uniref:Uncharacterized protein n=3 Tax=Nostocales TaxID=1161 RepID=A0A0C1QT62_9CYAN|nr:hypothetical protein [Tolypothrix bouteillei]KAF3889542.1 hypothetical protein DA73_0400031745 [Tolypothrix bouteillei VB521301]